MQSYIIKNALKNGMYLIFMMLIKKNIYRKNM